MIGVRAWLGALLVAAALGGCGSGGHAGAARPSAPPGGSASASPPAVSAPAPAPRLSPAKRRYLAHFAAGCGGTDRFAAATTARVRALVNRIAAGDIAAVPRLTSFLTRLAHAFGSGLAQTRALGPPPGPDAGFGRAYLAQAARMVAALHRLGRSVARLDAAGISAANGELKTATQAAHDAGQRYGFPTCGSGSAGSAAGGLVA